MESRRVSITLGKKLVFTLALALLLVLGLEITGWGLAAILEPTEGFLTYDARELDYGKSPLGIRGRSVDEPPRGYRILCLGDSFTFGHGVATEDAYPARLEEELRRRRPGVELEVLNAGQRGFNLVAEAHYLVERLDRLQPDLLLWQILRNDAEPSSHYFTHSMPGFMRQPGPILRRSRVYHLLYRRVLLPRWHRRCEAKLRSFYDPGSQAWRYVLESLMWVREQTFLRSLPVVVLLYPLVEETSQEHQREAVQLGTAARRTGFQVVDLGERLWPVEEGLERLRVSPLDHHPNAAGHALAVEALLQAVGAGGLVRSLDPSLPPPAKAP